MIFRKKKNEELIQQQKILMRNPSTRNLILEIAKCFSDSLETFNKNKQSYLPIVQTDLDFICFDFSKCKTERDIEKELIRQVNDYLLKWNKKSSFFAYNKLMQGTLMYLKYNETYYELPLPDKKLSEEKIDDILDNSPLHTFEGIEDDIMK